MKMRMTASLFLTRPVALLLLPFGGKFELLLLMLVLVEVVLVDKLMFFNWRILNSSSVGYCDIANELKTFSG